MGRLGDDEFGEMFRARRNPSGARLRKEGILEKKRRNSFVSRKEMARQIARKVCRISEEVGLS